MFYICTMNLRNAIKEIEADVEIAVIGACIKVEDAIEKVEAAHPKVCEFILEHQLTASQLTTP